MSKATVLRCDQCEQWDSKDNPVRTVGIAGPRFDLCSPCRVKKITEMGITPLNAAAYVEVFNARTQTAGAHLSLSAALKQWKETNPHDVAPQPDPETEDEESDELEEAVKLADVLAESEHIAAVVDAAAESSVDSPNGDHETVTVSADEEGAAETGKRPRGRARAR